MKRHRFHAVVLGALVAIVGTTAWAAFGAAPETQSASPEDRRVTEPLRHEHRELLPHIDALASAGDAVGVAGQARQQEMVHESYTFLTSQLIPHAVAEDKVLYATVDSLIGKSGRTRATDTMRRDHTEVGALTEELGTLAEQLHTGALPEAQQSQLRRVLYELHGIVGLHFAKEEEVYLPLLDRELSAAEAEDMFERMEKAAEQAGGADHQH